MATTNRIRIWMQSFSALAVAAAIATISGAIVSFIQVSSKPPQLSPIETSFTAELDKLTNIVGKHQTMIEDITSRLQAITSATGQSPTDIQIASVRAELASTAKRVDGLDAAILNSSTKALSIPLLRQELQEMKANYQRDIESYNKQIDRIYDQNKCLIGLMFSMAVGLIGLAISNFMQARSKSDSSTATGGSI
jgi:hypothetical protein